MVPRPELSNPVAARGAGLAVFRGTRAPAGPHPGTNGMPRTTSVPITMGASGVSSLALDDFQVTDAAFPAHERLAPHVHDRATLAIMIEGSFDLDIRNRVYACEPGTAFVEPAEERHANALGSAGAHVVVIQPDPCATEALGPAGRVFGAPFHVPRSPLVVGAWRIARELRTPDDATPLAVEGLILEMLALATRQDRPALRGRTTPPWLSHTREQLHATFQRPLRIRDLARAAGVHPDSLARAYQARYGVAIGTYVRRLRLDWAATQLEVGEAPIAQVALDAGFADQSHFTRAFRGHTGLAPAAYRRAFGRSDR